MTRPTISGISPFFIVADVPARYRSIAICWVLKLRFAVQHLTTSFSGLSAGGNFNNQEGGYMRRFSDLYPLGHVGKADSKYT